MKRRYSLLVLFTMLSLLLSLTCGSVFAAESAKVQVTIANGTLVLAGAEIDVTDIDGDGNLTINDALILAHDKAFEGGSVAGYTSFNGDYGLAISKLWGVENGGGYGYYINNVSAMSLADPIKNGDKISAFVYSDTANFSDIYCYFEVDSAYVATNNSVTLTLFAAAYDENWNPIVKPISGAVITIDGTKTEFITDENGKAVVTVRNAGSYTVSAVSDSATLVPPYCALSVGVAAPQTVDTSSICAAVLLAGLAIYAATKIDSVKKKF